MRARLPVTIAILAASSVALGSLAFLPTSLAEEAMEHYYVDPDNGDDAAAGSSGSPLETIQEALERAQPGNTIHLDSGEYRQDVRTVRDGTASAPITITGPKDAVVTGGGRGRIVEVNHDNHVFQGFTINGLHGNENRASGYRDKLLYAIGTEARDGVTGLKVMGMTLKNAGGECVRLRYFAQDNEIAGNTISDCGVYDFRFGGGGKNGEGVYIGTAPEQWGENGAPTDHADKSDDNHVHDNDIETNGNECVDIKESSSGNLVEDNTCTGQRDPNSAGLDSRGSGNSFVGNTVYGNTGAGIRFGGDKDTDGTDNDAYGNVIRDNKAGGIKFMAKPQGKVCGNTMSGNNGGNSVGEFKEDFDPAEPCDGDEGGGSTDAVDPTAPQDLTATVSDAGRVDLSWTASTDNVGVTRYHVYRDGAMIDSTTTTSYQDVNATPSQTHEYEVRAVDAAGNDSAPSNRVSVTVPEGPNASLLIFEDFSSPTAADRFKVVSGGRWRVRDGVYNLDRPGSKKKGNGNVSVHRTPVAGDFSLEAEASVKGTRVTQNDFSVIFGFRSLKNYCYASFNETNDARTSGIFQVRDGAVTELADIATPIRPDQFHRVRIEVDGSDVRVLLDGTEVATVSSSGCGDGQVGFGTRNDAARFDDLVVRRDATE